LNHSQFTASVRAVHTKNIHDFLRTRAGPFFGKLAAVPYVEFKNKQNIQKDLTNSLFLDPIWRGKLLVSLAFTHIGVYGGSFGVCYSLEGSVKLTKFSEPETSNKFAIKIIEKYAEHLQYQ